MRADVNASGDGLSAGTTGDGARRETGAATARARTGGGGSAITTILVADSVPAFGAGVRRVLERHRDVRVVEAATLDEVLAACLRAEPDIALIDLELPPKGGIAAVKALTRNSETRAVVWGFDPQADLVLGAIRAGACGFLARDLRPEGLMRALRGLAHGQAPITRPLAQSLIDALHRADDGRSVSERTATLSPRELEVLKHVALGARNRDIAGALDISEPTVKKHMHNILAKLSVPSRHAAGALYREALGREPALV